MTRQQIIEAWAWIRQNNQSIPDGVLDLMKDAAIDRIEKQNGNSASIQITDKDIATIEAMHDNLLEKGCSINDFVLVDSRKLTAKMYEAIRPKLSK